MNMLKFLYSFISSCLTLPGKYTGFSFRLFGYGFLKLKKKILTNWLYYNHNKMNFSLALKSYLYCFLHESAEPRTCAKRALFIVLNVVLLYLLLLPWVPCCFLLAASEYLIQASWRKNRIIVHWKTGSPSL